MIDVQQEAAELALKWMIKVPTLTADVLIAAIRTLMKRLENKEPMGRQSMNKLLAGGNHQLTRASVTSADIRNLGADMKMFERFARQYGVGFTVVPIIGAPGYEVFFRAKRADQMKACLEAFAKWKFYRDFQAPPMPGQQPPGRDARNPYTGEVLEERAIVPAQAQRGGQQQPYYVDYSMQGRRESIQARLNRAVAESTRRGQQSLAEGHGARSNNMTQRLQERGR